MSHTTRRIGALAAAAALTLGLAACSGGQSAAEACKIAESTISEVNQDTNALMQEVMQGDGDIAKLLEPTSEALDKASSEIENEEVSAALDDFRGEFNALTGELGALEIPNTEDIDPTDPDAMAELQSMQESLSAASESIQERSTALMDSAKNLQSVCNG